MKVRQSEHFCGHPFQEFDIRRAAFGKHIDSESAPAGADSLSKEDSVKTADND
jgi:hypothetical protein